MSDPANTLDRLAARAGQLYSLPAVAMKVLELTNNPQVDARALKECIENDPALTGKILRVVNSSLFGLSRQVSDLNQALALLGTKPLKLLVLGFSLPSGLFANVAGEVLGHYWRHALTKAVAGREISETLWKTPGDDAFIAGLLQDLGMLLLIQELGEPYVKFLEKAFAADRDLAAMEIESMGFDHTMLSARLLAHWGLPQTLVDAVAWKPTGRGFDFAKPNEQDLPQVLYLAELLARLLVDQQTAALGELLEVSRQCSRLSESQLESLVENLEEKVSQLAEVFKLQLPEGLDYRDVLVQAHAQLAAVANEAAEDLLRGEQREASPDEESLWSEVEDLSEAVARLSRARVESKVPSTAPAPEPAVAAAPAPATAGRPYSAAARVSSDGKADAELLNRLTVAVAACRQSRCPLSLLLVELEDEEGKGDSPHLPERPAGCFAQMGTVPFSQSGRGRDFGNLKRLLETACRNVDHPFKICLAHGEAGVALILPNCERRLAVELGNQLIDKVRRVAPHEAGNGRKGVSLSVGAATVALPPRNFLPANLLTGANRCLYGSHASGGGVVKSIEIY